MFKILWVEIRNIDTSRKALRSFGLLVGAVLLGIAGIVFWRSGWLIGPPVYWLGGIGSALVLLGAAIPNVLRPIYLVWMALAVILGYVMTRVILTFVYYLVITPTGLIMRALGRDPLNRDIDPSAPTYWITKEYVDDSPKRLEKYY